MLDFGWLLLIVHKHEACYITSTMFYPALQRFLPMAPPYSPVFKNLWPVNPVCRKPTHIAAETCFIFFINSEPTHVFYLLRRTHTQVLNFILAIITYWMDSIYFPPCLEPTVITDNYYSWPWKPISSLSADRDCNTMWSNYFTTAWGACRLPTL